MAKSQRNPLPELPLSRAFYDALVAVGSRLGLGLADRSALAEAVAALSEVYTQKRGQLGQGKLGNSAPLARLGFFLPRDMIKLFGPLDELARENRLPARPTLRVLDLGAGLGATTLGLSRYLRRANSPVQRLQVTAVERDPGSLKLMAALCEAVRGLPAEFTPIELEVSHADLLRDSEAGQVDFVLLGFVLNELFLERSAEERPRLRAELLCALSQRLSADGAAVVLEPALKDSARELMRTRDALVEAQAAPHVYAPCVHRAPCPMLARERDWCHESLDYALPPQLAEIAKRAGLRFEGLSYAALVLTRSPRFASEAPRQRIVSDRLRSKGKLELFGCGLAGYQRLVRLDRDHNAQNARFERLRRGDIIELEGTRVDKATLIP